MLLENLQNAHGMVKLLSLHGVLREDAYSERVPVRVLP